jgi:hypothetical protein
LLNFLECDFACPWAGSGSSALLAAAGIGTVFATAAEAMGVYSRGNLEDDFCYESAWILFTLGILASLILFLMTSYILASYTSVILGDSGITFTLRLSLSDIF